MSENFNFFNITSHRTISEIPEDLSLAIAYVPFQTKFNPYSSEEGLSKGTLFPGLYKPFTGKRGVL